MKMMPSGSLTMILYSPPFQDALDRVDIDLEDDDAPDRAADVDGRGEVVAALGGCRAERVEARLATLGWHPGNRAGS